MSLIEQLKSASIARRARLGMTASTAPRFVPASTPTPKLAALATKAQMRRRGGGIAPAARAAA